jgi:hypothetical protein
MEGNINYMELCNNPKFKRIQYIFKIKQGLKQEVDLNKESESPYKFQGSQKIVIESIIHISSEDVFVFTTVSPKTSMIFIAKMKNTSVVTSGLADKFEAQIVAKLEGHSSNEPPSLLYVNESGCLISGEKLPAVKEGLTSAAFEGKNNDTFSRFYSNVTNNKARSANILIWNLSKDLFEETRVNPPWKLKPSRIV